MSLPAAMDFTLNPDASPARMNSAMTTIDQRLSSLEIPAKNLDQVIAQIQSIGLQRLTDAIKPIYDQALTLVNLGALLTAHSSSPGTCLATLQPFIIDEIQRGGFATSLWMAATSDDGEAYLVGQVIAYHADTGLLSFNIVETNGTGAHTGWTFSPTTSPTVASTFIDGGVLDGTDPSAVTAFTFTPTAP